MASFFIPLNKKMNFIKIILTLFLIPLLACSAQQEETNKFIEITYSARTRGYQMTIIYKEDKLTVSSNISNKTISLTNKQQVKIQKEFKVTPHYLELEVDQETGYKMGVYICLGQEIHEVSPEDAIDYNKFKSFEKDDLK